MKNLHLVLSLAFLSVLFYGCKKEELQATAPTNVLINGDLETYPFPQWYSSILKKSITNLNMYAVDYSIEAASSPAHSIKVSCDAIKSDSTFQLVGQTVLTKAVPIPEGAKLTFKVKIKTVNIQGNGISVVLGGYSVVNGVSSDLFYTSTEGKLSIAGTNDFKEYTITFDSAPKNLTGVYADVFYLPKTTGTAYYDDMSLTIN